MRSDKVYLLLISGKEEEAREAIALHYPGSECVALSKRELRVSGFRHQIEAFRKIEGKALVFFFRSTSELQEPLLTAWSGLFHRCRATVFADSTGEFTEYTLGRLFRRFPATIASAFLDLLVFTAFWPLLQLLRASAHPIAARPQNGNELDLAFLYPYPLDMALAGGAHSHVKGFLSGAAAAGACVEIFTGRSLALGETRQHLVPAGSIHFLFRESLMLSYNLRFAFKVRKFLRAHRTAGLYQRHGRFVVAGVLLSRWLRLPLILEFNGSELWVAKYWDPARFQRWLKAAEEASLAGAHLIVVVSQALKDELQQQGIPESRILVNPNGVDPTKFHPGCGRKEIRRQLNIAETDIVASFVGTFDRWHGIMVLQEAIRRILDVSAAEAQRLKFLLIGEGALSSEMRTVLQEHVGNRVLFTGLIPHAEVPSYLDAADILVSPHVPMPDGRPFFGSPTKLFEYMAMAKAIVASNLAQISKVLQHRRTAWLVEPGNVGELASALVLLAEDPDLRDQLGQKAREDAIANHTWRQNAERVLTALRLSRPLAVGAARSGAQIA